MKKLQLPDKVYKIFKWILMIVVPASITLLTSLTMAWGWDIPLEPIVTTISAVATFVGVIMGISNANYYHDDTEDGDGDLE